MSFLTKELIYQKSSQELTSLLYEACIDNLTSGIQLIEEKEFIDANIKLQKVNDILERLGVGINYEAGIIADQLDTLYNYMANNVVQGNLKKDTKILKEVLHILELLASAWNEVLNKQESKPQRLQQQQAYEQNVMVLRGEKQ